MMRPAFFYPIALLCISSLSFFVAAATGLVSLTDQIPALPLEPEWTDGEVSLAPAEIQARSGKNFVQVTITTGARPIEPGGRIELVFGCQVIDMGAGPMIYAPQLLSWSPFQDWDAKGPSYITLEPIPGASKVRLELPSRLDRLRWGVHLFSGKHHDILDYSGKELNAQLARLPITIRGAALPGSSRLELHLGGTEKEGAGIPGSPRETRIDIAALVDYDGDGTLQLMKQPGTLTVTAGKAKKLRVVAPSIARPGDALTLTVQAVDEYDARDVAYIGKARVRLEPSFGEWQVEFSAENRGEIKLPLTAPPEGIYRFSVEGVKETRRSDLAASSQPLLVRTSGERLFWGDTHRHSVLADGFLPPAAIYRIAVQEEHLDWMCLSEHSHPEPFNVFGTYFRRLTLSPTEWSYLLRLADSFDAYPDFSTLQGFEWTSDAGHRNVYFHPDEDTTALTSHLEDGKDMAVARFLETYQNKRVFIIPHHPAWKLWGGPYDWGPSELADRLQRLVEVYSQHGNSEYYNNPRKIHGGPVFRKPPPIVRFFLGRDIFTHDDQTTPDGPGFVRNALAAGRKMGLIGSSDNHFLEGGDASWSGGIAAVWANENSRASIWQSLDDRYAYGTSGARMVLELTVNGSRIGTDGVRVTEKARVKGQVLGTAALKTVEVVRFDSRGYDVAWSHGDAETDVAFDFEDATVSGGGFYYLRVEQRDGELGWAGPIWTVKD